MSETAFPGSVLGFDFRSRWRTFSNPESSHESQVQKVSLYKVSKTPKHEGVFLRTSVSVAFALIRGGQALPGKECTAEIYTCAFVSAPVLG